MGYFRGSNTNLLLHGWKRLMAAHQKLSFVISSPCGFRCLCTGQEFDRSQPYASPSRLRKSFAIAAIRSAPMQACSLTCSQHTSDEVRPRALCRLLCRELPELQLQFLLALLATHWTGAPHGFVGPLNEVLHIRSVRVAPVMLSPGELTIQQADIDAGHHLCVVII